MTDLHQQLQSSIRELEQIRKIKEHTAELNTRLTTEQAALDAMEITLTKEQRDVDTLEREGLTTMFRKFLGDREEKLEKEREEYLRASLRYNELYKSVALIRYELELLSKKADNEDVVKNRIEVQMRMREEEIIQLDAQTGAELKNLHAQADQLSRFLVEIEEAFQAGSVALDFVRKTEQYLHQAQGWGQRDMWGGSHGSGYLKHQALDQAKDMAYQSRHALIRFSHELKDVFRNAELQVNMEIEELGKFGDLFFDNIISDLIGQQKINKSLANVTTTRQQIEQAMGQIEEEKRNVENKITDLERQRREIILNSNS